VTVDPAALTRLRQSAGHDAVVGVVTPLAGGASSATFAVAAQRDGAAWPLVFQRGADFGGEPGRAARMARGYRPRSSMLPVRMACSPPFRSSHLHRLQLGVCG